MPQKPTMPSPYMKAVDASKPITFSCNIDSRDTIVDYEFSLSEIESSEKNEKSYILPPVYIGTIIESDGYSNKICFYKESIESEEYTILVQPTTSRRWDKNPEIGTVKYDKNGRPSPYSCFTINDTTIYRKNITRIIYIKGSIEKIPPQCFLYFPNLKKCEIYGDYSGDNGIVFETKLFEYCEKLEEVIMPHGNMRNDAYFPKSLKRATLYADINRGFKSSKSLEELVFKTEGLESPIKFSDYKCAWSSSLKSVTFSGSGKIKIGSYAFRGCAGLKQVFSEISNITEIGEWAFERSGIEKICINNNLTNIKKYAFYQCNSLSSIYVYSLNDDLIKNLRDMGSVSSKKIFTKDTNVTDKTINIYYFSDEIKISTLKSLIENDTIAINCYPMYNSENFTKVPVYGGSGDSSILSHTKMAGELANDREYAWWVKLKDALGHELTSPHYYFKTCGTPNVELNRILSEATETKKVKERSDCLWVTHDIYHDMSIVVEKYTEEIDDGDGGLMGDITEPVEILEDVFYYYPKGKQVYCNVSTSVVLEKDDSSEDYYFQLPYYPITNNKEATIVVSGIEAGDNQIKLEYVEDITGDNVVLYKFKVISEIDDVFVTGETYRLTYDCCFEPENYRITYYFVKPLEGHTQSFFAFYNMKNSGDKYIPIKSHRWELYEKTDTENVLIDETGDIFSAYLSYEYDKFLPSKNYIIKIEIENDEGFIISDEYEFSTATADGNAIEVIPQISLDKKHNAVILDFSECSYQNRYSVIRKDASSSKYKSIANSIAGGCKVYDYTAASNTEHIYTVYELKDGVLSVQDLEPIMPRWTNTSVIGFNGSYADKSIISVDKENVWGFGLNIGKREYFQVLSKNIVSSICSRFAKSISGKTNYRTFSLSGYLGEIDCESKYSNDTALLSTKWDKFAASPMAKFVVDTKGHVFICDVTDSSYGYTDEYAEQPTMISVSFAEIAPSEDISLVRVERGG